MKCNVYDFDHTIYDGDSTIDFYKLSIKRYPFGLIMLPGTFTAWLLYRAGIFTKTQFKERFYVFLKYIPNIDRIVEEFWVGHEKKIKQWYLSSSKNTDVIISASPEFLLAPICQKLKIHLLIASKVDKKTGKYHGENCYGEEKVRRLRTEVPAAIIEEFYSDSHSDQYLANLAIKSYLVCGESIIKWECNQPKMK